MNLKELIMSDPKAKELAELGAADACAARCREIAPKIYKECRVTELTFFAAYSDPSHAEGVLRKIEAAGSANPVIARILKWLAPGAPGVDIGNDKTRAILLTPVESGGVGLTEAETQELFAIAMTEPTITGADVTTAMLGDN